MVILFAMLCVIVVVVKLSFCLIFKYFFCEFCRL